MSVSPPVEGLAMTAGRSVRIRLIALPVVAAIGFLAWGLVSAPSDAESKSEPVASPDTTAQNTTVQTPARFDPAVTPTDATLASPTVASPAQEVAPAETAPAASPLDGLKISSQSWRRAGLGSNAQVTLTLRNRNDYAVRDIEIACAFSRRDGSHLTDRSRTIHDTVSMKSRKTFSRMHVGFVNINADKAKCALVAASRI
jgi:hypothetical protein